MGGLTGVKRFINLFEKHLIHSRPQLVLEQTSHLCLLNSHTRLLEIGRMFFTPDLLTRRDSGFGLLWYVRISLQRTSFLTGRRLAATLGSKTALKNLSKKSVMTANITQLCDLIAEPMEPLALRLSSNLMYGVVR